MIRASSILVLGLILVVSCGKDAEETSKGSVESVNLATSNTSDSSEANNMATPATSSGQHSSLYFLSYKKHYEKGLYSKAVYKVDLYLQYFGENLIVSINEAIDCRVIHNSGTSNSSVYNYLPKGLSANSSIRLQPGMTKLTYDIPSFHYKGDGQGASKFWCSIVLDGNNTSSKTYLEFPIEEKI